MKSPNVERVGIPFDEDESRAFKGHSRKWKPSGWNHNGKWYKNLKSGRVNVRPKRKEVK